MQSWTTEGEEKGALLLQGISNNSFIDEEKWVVLLRDYSKSCGTDREKATRLLTIVGGDCAGGVANKLIPEICTMLKSFQEQGDKFGLLRVLERMEPVVRHLGSDEATTLAQTIRGFAENGMDLMGFDVRVLSALSERTNSSEHRQMIENDVISRVIEKPVRSNQEVLAGSLVAPVEKVDAFLRIVTDQKASQSDRREAAERVGKLLTEANSTELDRRVAGVIFKAGFDFRNPCEGSMSPDEFLNEVPTRVYLLQRLGESLLSRSSGAEAVELQKALQLYSVQLDVPSLFNMASSVQQIMETRAYGISRK